MKCIKYKCKYYFNSDDYAEICHVNNEYCVSGECIGLDKIQGKMEAIACEISKLSEEYINLHYLKSFIRENQSANIIN